MYDLCNNLNSVTLKIWAYRCYQLYNFQGDLPYECILPVHLYAWCLGFGKWKALDIINCEREDLYNNGNFSAAVVNIPTVSKFT